MGVIKVIPTNRYPYEATELLNRQSMFNGPGLVLNRVPKQDCFVRNRTMPAERKTAALGPVYTLKGADVGVSPPPKRIV